jgi:PmbA protein
MAQSLTEVGVKAVQAAIKARADQAEALLNRTHYITITVEKGAVKNAYTVADEGLSVRAISHGSVGFSYSTTLEKEIATTTAQSASAQAKAGTPDPEFRSLPQPKKLPSVERLFDKATAEVDAAELLELAVAMAEAQKIDKRISSVNSAFRCGWQERAVVNSLGVECQDMSTLVYAESEAIARENGEMSSSLELKTARSLGEIDPQRIGRVAAEYAVKSLHGKKIETARLPVVLDSIAASSIFLVGIVPGVNAENVQYKRSYLCEKLGKQIGSDRFTAVDDGTCPGGVGSVRFDAEGTPSQKTAIIQKGILQSYVYDSYTASKDTRESTGNAFRVVSGDMFQNYRGVPAIGVRNLVIEPGSGTLEDLMSDVKKGIFLRTTWDRPNIATGEFSGLIAEGYKIEDGEATHAIRQTNIGINMIDFFKRIIAVAADSRQFQLPPRGPFCVISPSITIEEAMISGAQA